MEAVPRLPMLSFDLKVSPERTSFGPKLKQYIRDFYHEDPEMYSNEIHSLEGLRASAVCAVRDVTGCSTLKRYYCQLHFLQSRFPMHKDGAAAVPFTWRDTYASMVCTLADIRFEMVAILYNIGALHSQLGAADSRTTSDGMKMSCTHFQCAAWAFQHLKDSFPQPAGVDLAPDVMQFMYHLSLAQAQECILEKSMMDNRKATIIAKVAAQIVDYYNLALNTLEQGGSDDCTVSETVGSKVYKAWKRYVKFKTAYHSCVALLYQGQQAEEQQKMGERVAYYQAASDKLDEAAKLSKGMDHTEVINEALVFTADVVEGKKKAAKNENEFIYHEEVPDKDTLPDVKGASLVKGIPFNVNDPEISGPDIFARLVPMKAHEASSLYSEEKARLLRRVGADIDEKDEELVSFMTSLQLEHLNIHTDSSRLPQELVDRCAAISVKPDAIQTLIDSMNKLSDTYHDVEAMLQEIKELLQEEEIQEKEYQEVVGKRPPSIVATDLTREASKYQEAHGKASESNQTLHKAMMLHVSNLRVLAQPLSELQKSIPEVAPPATPDDESTVEELRRLVAKVEEMRRQRAMLSSQLRESICQDDITRQLVTRASEPLEAIFNQELQKHQRYVSLVEQNLAAQENILRALTDAYAKYGSTRKATNEAVRKRETTIAALIASYDAYEDLLAKSNKGLEFYRKLEVNVSKLLQRVRSACKVQQEEREQVLAKAMPSAVSTASAVSAAAATTAAVSPASGMSTLPGNAVLNGPSDISVVEMSSAPKLRDYLQSMKRGAAAVGGYGSATVTSTATPPDMSAYYASSYAHGALGLSTTPISSGSVSSSSAIPSGANSTVFYDQISTSTTQSQWALPPVRPAPVGSEGPDVSQAEPITAKTQTSTVASVADVGKPSSIGQSYQLPDSSVLSSGGYPPGYLAGAAYGTVSGSFPSSAQSQLKSGSGPLYQQYGSFSSSGFNHGLYPSPPSTSTSVYMYTGPYHNQVVGTQSSQVSYPPTGTHSTVSNSANAYIPSHAGSMYQVPTTSTSQRAYQLAGASGYQTGMTTVSQASGVAPHSSLLKPYRSTFDKLFAPQGSSQQPTSQQLQPTVSGAADSSGYIAGSSSYSGIWPQHQYSSSLPANSQYQQYMSQTQGQYMQSQPLHSQHYTHQQQLPVSQYSSLQQPHQQTTLQYSQQLPQQIPQQQMPQQLPQQQMSHQLSQQHVSQQLTQQQIAQQPVPQQQMSQQHMPQQQLPQQQMSQQQLPQQQMSQQQLPQQQISQQHLPQQLMSQQQLPQQQMSQQQVPQQQVPQQQAPQRHVPQQQAPQQQVPQQQTSQQQLSQQFSQQQLSHHQSQSLHHQYPQQQHRSQDTRHVKFALENDLTSSQQNIPDNKMKKSSEIQSPGPSGPEPSHSQTSMYGVKPVSGGAGDQPWSQQQLASPYTPGSAYSAYPYISASSASHYTSAGRYPTSQTSSLQTGVEGQTFADQYSTSSTAASIYPAVAEPQRAYYTTPYGYQSPDSPAQQTPPNPLDPQNMTYMQASGNKQTTTTTYMYPAAGTNTAGSQFSYQTYSQYSAQVPVSTPAAAGPAPAAGPVPAATPTPATASAPAVAPTSTPSSTESSQKTSNVDLLAGLDFSLNQVPLTPQSLTVAKNEDSSVSTTTSASPPVSASSSSANFVTNSATSIAPPVQSSATTSEVKLDTNHMSVDSQVGGVSRDVEQSSESEGVEGNRATESRQSKVTGKDPYSDSEVLNQFVQEVEKYEKFVEGLTSKTLNGPTPLDIKWKELLDFQEKDAHKRSISVARCYPMKNRFPDILPYDNSRVELPSTKDDYINASFVKDITSLTPSFILTQAPLPSTVNDFWTMVMEQQVEIVVCLLSDAELSGQVYWPAEKSQEMVSGKLRLTLQTCNTRTHWVERILSVTCSDTRSTRVIVHLQFTGWPGSSFPPSPGPFLALLLEVLSLHKQQRVASHPLVVHCLSGVGRSGLLCVLAAALLEVQAGRGLIELVPVAASISSQRKNCLRDRQHLQFAYQALLYHAQDLLMKRGILTTRSTFEDKRNRGTKCHTRHPSEDFLLGAPADLSQLQSGLDSMGLGANLKASSEGNTEPEMATSTSSKESSDQPDPLSQLDPLWSLKNP